MRAVREAPIDCRVLHVLRVIEANRSADVRELARAVHLSPSHLRHLFKAALGMSIVQYAIERRMEYAWHLFLTTDWAVKRIAIESGFLDGSNFIRYFKRRFGILPSEFRARHRSVTPSAGDAGVRNTLSSES